MNCIAYESYLNKAILKVQKSLKEGKGNYSLIYWMNIHEKFLNKILVSQNQVLWSIKWIITEDYMGLISGTQSVVQQKQINQCNTPYEWN